MTSRLRTLALSLWASLSLATPALTQDVTSGGTTRDQLIAQPVHTVDAVDLDRYSGDWFEVARFPNRFQR